MSETNEVTSQVESVVSYEALQKRLMNTEMALVGLWSLLQDLMPRGTQSSVGQMMNEYFDANTEMGADFDLSKGWNINS